MDTLQGIVYGLVQGLTEFIPVSSSGHLVIAQHFFNGQSEHRFLEFINVGTLAALLVYYRHKIIDITTVIIEQKNYSLLRNILLTSLPAGIVGYLLSDVIDSISLFGSLYVVATTLAVVGFIMVILERLPRSREVSDGAALSWKKALVIGVAQMFALIPGVSRSGSTIIAGRLAGLAPDRAADYSFLASLPIMIAVTLNLFVKASDRAYLIENLPALIIGNVVAFIAGVIAIGFLLNYLSKHDLRLFGWYRIALAGIILAVLLIQ